MHKITVYHSLIDRMLQIPLAVIERNKERYAYINHKHVI